MLLRILDRCISCSQAMDIACESSSSRARRLSRRVWRRQSSRKLGEAVPRYRSEVVRRESDDRNKRRLDSLFRTEEVQVGLACPSFPWLLLPWLTSSDLAPIFWSSPFPCPFFWRASRISTMSTRCSLYDMNHPGLSISLFSFFFSTGKKEQHMYTFLFQTYRIYDALTYFFLNIKYILYFHMFIHFCSTASIVRTCLNYCVCTIHIAIRL